MYVLENDRKTELYGRLEGSHVVVLLQIYSLQTLQNKHKHDVWWIITRCMVDNHHMMYGGKPHDDTTVHTTYTNWKWRKRITRKRCYGVRITREAFFTACMKRDYLYENFITQIICDLHNHA